MKKTKMVSSADHEKEARVVGNLSFNDLIVCTRKSCIICSKDGNPLTTNNRYREVSRTRSFTKLDQYFDTDSSQCVQLLSLPSSSRQIFYDIQWSMRSPSSTDQPLYLAGLLEFADAVTLKPVDEDGSAELTIEREASNWINCPCDLQSLQVPFIGFMI